MRKSPVLTAAVFQKRRWGRVSLIQPICDATANPIQVVATSAIGTALKLALIQYEYTNVKEVLLTSA